MPSLFRQGVFGSFCAGKKNEANVEGKASWVKTMFSSKKLCFKKNFQRSLRL